MEDAPEAAAALLALGGPSAPTGPVDPPQAAGATSCAAVGVGGGGALGGGGAPLDDDDAVGEGAPTVLHCPLPTEEDGTPFWAFVYLLVVALNDHYHTFTCKSDKSNSNKCRLAYAQCCFPMGTVPVELDGSNLLPGTAVPRMKSAVTAPQPELDNPLHPLPPPEKRVIQFELCRPPEGVSVEECNRRRDEYFSNFVRTFDVCIGEGGTPAFMEVRFLDDCSSDGPNKYIVFFSPGITGATGSNTSVNALFNSDAARAAFYYIAGYVAKDRMDSKQMLPICIAAFDSITKYPSTALDSGGALRTALHFMTRVLNSTTTEMHSVSAGLWALGFKNEVLSHKPEYWHIRPLLAYVLHRVTALRLFTGDVSSLSQDLEDAQRGEAGETDCVLPAFLLAAVGAGDADDDDTAAALVGEAAAMEPLGRYNPVLRSVVEPFWPLLCRGKALEMLSSYEYTAMIGLRKLRSPAQTGTKH